MIYTDKQLLYSNAEQHKAMVQLFTITSVVEISPWLILKLKGRLVSQRIIHATQITLTTTICFISILQKWKLWAYLWNCNHIYFVYFAYDLEEVACAFLLPLSKSLNKLDQLTHCLQLTVRAMFIFFTVYPQFPKTK